VHLIDRLAFDGLGPEYRSWFIDPLVSEIIDIFAAMDTDEGKVREMRAAFVESLNQRTAEYGRRELIAKQNVNGGLAIRNTIAWHFGEILGLNDDIGPMLFLVSEIPQRYLAYRNDLQIPELILGYEQIRRTH
jgi:hypothetical protein